MFYKRLLEFVQGEVRFLSTFWKRKSESKNHEHFLDASYVNWSLPYHPP